MMAPKTQLSDYNHLNGIREKEAMLGWSMGWGGGEEEGGGREVANSAFITPGFPAGLHNY